MLALANDGKLTPELALFIRSRDSYDVIDKMKEFKLNKAMLMAMGLPVLKKPSAKIATPQEIKRYLELHCSLIGMEYTGYQEVDKITGMNAKLDKEWESDLTSLQISTGWYELGLPNRIARMCGAASMKEAYAPLMNLFERNVWVYGPDRQTFEWYVYDATGEKLDYYN